MTFVDLHEHWQAMAPRAYTQVSPVLLALGLLALTLATVRKRGTPGFASVAFAPQFALATLMATTGAFVLRYIPLGGVAQYGLSLPLPDMDQLLFGPSVRANPLFYSAIIPVIASVVGVRWAQTRRVVQGLCFGFGGTMLAAAWHGYPGLSVISAPWASVGWLAVNAAVACFVARAMFVADSTKA